MSDLSAVSTSCNAPVDSQSLRQHTISRLQAKGLPFSHEAKSAAWMKQGTVPDRRNHLRSTVAFDVELMPLDQHLQPLGPVYQGRLINYSCDGASLEHSEVLPESYVQIRWRDSRLHEHSAILRLKWCRYVTRHLFLSGGRVVGMN